MYVVGLPGVPSGLLQSEYVSKNPDVCTQLTDTVAFAVTERPAKFVTVRTNVVCALTGTVNGVPLVIGTPMGETSPVPPLNRAVNVVDPLNETVFGVAMKFEMVGAATVVTVSLSCTESPAALVTLSTYTAVEAVVGVTGRGVPLVIGALKKKLLTTPVPPVKEAVNVVVSPRVMVCGEALNAAMVGRGTTVNVVVRLTEDVPFVTVRV